MGTVTEVGGLTEDALRPPELSAGPLRGQQSRPASTRTFLMFVDLLLVWLSSFLCLTVRFGAWPWRTHAGRHSISDHFFFLLLFSVLLVLFSDARKLYTDKWYRNRPFKPTEPLKAIGAAALLMTAAVYFSGIKIISREVMAGSILSSTVTILAWRYWWRSQAIEGLTEHRNIIILGTGRVAAALRAYLSSNPQLGFIFQGYLDSRARTREGNSAPDAELLGGIQDLHSIARSRFIDEILITDASNRELVKNVTIQARALGIDVRVVPDLYDGLALGASIESVGRFPTISLHAQPVSATQYVLKRVLDVALSSICLICLSPVMCLVAIVIKSSSQGPVIYSSERVGKKGKTFRCYKFRTMVVNAEELKLALEHLNERDGILFKISEDPRITRVGRFLRAWSIDELPQLFNVLKGDMSLVGPRPGLPSEFDRYALDDLRRLEVLPGVTGLWQVEARNDPSFDQYINHDLQYIENWSIWLDLRVLAKTLRVVVTSTGR